ncbi:MAG TPA: hypothetical protein VHL09_03420 [Dehalococcoidia bacterium]|nr:hypothetical protein [Dehalococcoidia bacterium]
MADRLADRALSLSSGPPPESLADLLARAGFQARDVEVQHERGTSLLVVATKPMQEPSSLDAAPTRT